MEDDLKKIKKNKNGRRPKKKWKTNQSTKINLIGCDTIVNSPSFHQCVVILTRISYEVGDISCHLECKAACKNPTMLQLNYHFIFLTHEFINIKLMLTHIQYIKLHLFRFCIKVVCKIYIAETCVVILHLSESWSTL